MYSMLFRRMQLAVGALSALGPVILVGQRPVDTLSTVQVTVLRTPFDLTRAPFSVTVVSTKDATAARPGFAMDEVLGRLAGVQVDNRLNVAVGERIAIRGLGARSQFGVRGVRIIVDDIPATLADGQTVLNNVDLGSLGHAQLLRGPASALYGNASGGVVILESAPPPPVLFSPSLRLLAGSDGLRRFQVGVGGMHGNTGYTVNAGRVDYGGFRAFSTARNFHANGVATHEAGRVFVKVVANTELHNAQNPGSLSDSLLRIDRRQAFTNNVAQRTGEAGSQTQGGVSTRVILPTGELRFALYALHRALDNPIPPRVIALQRNAGGARAAYAVTTEHAHTSITALLGVESDIQRDNRQNWVNTQGVRGAVTLDQHERVTSMAPFAQVTAAAGPFSLFSGIRYDHVRFAVTDALVTSSNPDDSGARNMTAFSPSVGISYTPFSGATIYANVASAFQTPTTTELANSPTEAGGFNPALGPERVRSVEAGLNGRFLGRGSYHAALYRMRIRDALVPFELASFPGRQFYRNVGEATHRGAEAEAGVIFTSHLLGRLAYTYTDARFTADTAGALSNAGDRLPGVIPHTLTASLDAGTTRGRFVTLETRVQSSTPVNDANTVHSPGYVVVALRGNLPLHRGTALFGGIGNLLNRRYNTSVVANAVGGRYFEPAAGRTIYFGVDLKRIAP